ncbi:recombinase family protein [Streptomyces olivochromogenes]|uniref:recombinase family protein n=1 Tax=Streptomyces olivochromogenes TaxID=1963 RepID=UPI0036C5F7ED
MRKTEDTRRNAIIYTRISSDPTGNAGGVTRQEEACRKLAAELGWAVVGVKVDDDKTAYGKNGMRAKRPGYAELLDMLNAGRADAVLTWHTDRLYRQARDLEPLIDIVTRTGTVVRPVKQGELDLATASGRMVARIMADVSTHEIEHAIERMKEAKESNRAAGLNPGGPRPFGYRPVKRHAKGEKPEVQQLNPREAALIRKAARDVLTGKSLSSICRDWTKKGVTTPKGNAWQISPLGRLLTGARIAGKIEFEGEITGDAVWPAIIDYPTLLAVRAVLLDPARRGNPQSDNKIKWLGSGIYRCHCGEPMRIGSSQGGRARYRCNATGPGHVNRDAADLDQYVEAELIEYLIRTSAVDVDAVGPETAEPDPETADLEAEVTRQRARLDALAAAFAGDGDPLEYRTAARSIRDKIADLEDKIAEQVTAAHEDEEPDGYGLSPLEAWPQYDIVTKRAILRSRVRVTVLPGRRGRPPKDAPKFDTSLIELEWAPKGQPFKD